MSLKSNEYIDTVSLLIQCVSDSSYLFYQENTMSELSLPYSKIVNDNSACKQASQDLFEIFSLTLPIENLFRIYKFWVPNNNCHVQNYLFNIKVDNDQKEKSKNTSGRYRGKLSWINDLEVYKIYVNGSLRSPEIFEVIMSVKSRSSLIPDTFKVEGINCIGMFMEMSENIVNISNSFYDPLLEAASLTKNSQIILYKEFLTLCYPNFYMGPSNFNKFFSNLGWASSDLPDLFRAADIYNRHGISYREFLYIIAVVETLEMSSVVADIRYKYMFRFFDKDGDNLLRTDELRNLFGVIKRMNKVNYDNASIMKEVTEFYKSILLPDGSPVSLVVFNKAITEGKLKYTSSIFHSPRSILYYLRGITTSQSKLNLETKRAKFRASSMNNIEKMRNKSGLMSSASLNETVRYELGQHTVKIFTAGIITVDKVYNLDCVSPSSTQRPVIDDLRRRVSLDQFNQESITNELLKSLRYMDMLNKQKLKQTQRVSSSVHFTWSSIDNALFGRRLISVCRLVTELLKKEPRLLKIPPPTYILGDLHGNFNDLMQFESILWHVGPCLCPSNILFLGDYVDRGFQSIEVVTYLFCYKVQNPTKIRLIRGNHEIREVQKMFTFFSECTNKFGEKLGYEVWCAVNIAFDYLPIAAVVDNTIFCCHGGIPPPWLCPTASCIDDIPSPLTQPDEQSALAWELMWNDPVKIKQVPDAVLIELSTNEGFAFNKRRGTAHIFTAEALEKFLKCNNYSHLIRAHEVSPAGFSMLHKGKLLTVFSSSKYCGGHNDASCIMADQGRLRVLRVEAEF